MKLTKIMFIQDPDNAGLVDDTKIGIYELDETEMNCLKKYFSISGKYVLMSVNTLSRQFGNDPMNEFLKVITKDKDLYYKGTFETQLEAELYCKCATLEAQINNIRSWITTPVIRAKEM